MAYTTEGWTEVKIEAGKVSEATVVSIDDGTLGRFVKPENWEKFSASGNVSKDDPAIEITASNGSKVLIRLPEGKTYHPKSKFGKWVRTYGKAPYEGQKVKTVMDADGYENILLLD